MTTVLITGCSSGIGLATTVEFARNGCEVVATMRDLARSQPLRAALDAARVGAELRTLDVADDVSVATGIEAVLVERGAIDVVISNAGVGIDGTTEELSIDDFRLSFETNTLGSVRLLKALLPSWRRQGGGRFLAVGSIAGVIGMPFNDAYCTSKFALEGVLESLQPVAAQHGVAISVVEAGPVAGEFADRYGPPAGRKDGVYETARSRFQQIQDGGYDTAQSAEEIAHCLWQIATDPAPALRYQTSEMVSRMLGVKLKDLDGTRVTGMTGKWI
jgi:NAD(P)-dependent dehydrogenase (short-subunit alcohol dehydrogenase family)